MQFKQDCEFYQVSLENTKLLVYVTSGLYVADALCKLFSETLAVNGRK